MANPLRHLQQRLELYLVAKAIVLGCQRLSRRSLGKRLNLLMDETFGKLKGDAMQQELAAYLRQLAEELLS